MRTLFFIFFLLFTLTGCSGKFPGVFSPRPPDERLFLQGMEDWRPGGDFPAAFDTLLKTYPDSPWAEKIRSVNELTTTRAKQQTALDRLEREVNSCRQENKLLQQQKKALENDQEKLKKLLIELERR
jgi:hypothetical protein